MKYFIFLAILATNCAVFERREKKSATSLPPMLQTNFRQCSPLDGNTRLTYTAKPGDTVELNQVDLGWNAPRNAPFTAEALDPLGRTIFEITLPFKGIAQVELSPEIAAKAAGVFESKDLKSETGKIYYKDHDTALRISELGCLMSGSFPAVWLAQGFYEEPVTMQGRQFSLESDDRQIAVFLLNSGRQGCATIVRRHFLGMVKQRLVYCFDRSSGIAKQTFKDPDATWMLSWENQL